MSALTLQTRSTSRYGEAPAWPALSPMRTAALPLLCFACGGTSVGDPSTLDEAAVLARLFPGFPGATLGHVLPEGWQIGQKPAAPLAIDEEIDKLITSNHSDAPRLRPEVIGRFLPACPYYAGRQAALVAARAGRHEMILSGAGESAKFLAGDIDKIARDLRAILKRLPADIEASTTPLDRRLDPIASFKARQARVERRNVLAAALEALDDEAAELRAGHERVRDAARGKPWHLGFVRALGFSWCTLTGRQPPRGEDSRFAEFVMAACHSLDRDAEEQWASPIKRAIRQVNTWPSWAAFDWLTWAAVPSVVTSLRRYDTMEHARAGAGRMAERLVRFSEPFNRSAFEQHGRDLIRLAVATAGDAAASFGEVLEAAIAVADFQRKVWADLRAETEALSKEPPQQA